MTPAQPLKALLATRPNARRMAFLPPHINEHSDKTRLYIFTVGPKRLEVDAASYGVMFIRPCMKDSPENREMISARKKDNPYQGKLGEYSEPLVTPGIPYEFYCKEGTTSDPLFHGSVEDLNNPAYDAGFDFACQLVGGFTDAKGAWCGKLLRQANSLENAGVGISRVWPPSQEDIELARKKLNTGYAKLVQEANEQFAVGKFADIRTDDHFVAAHALGKTVRDCKWLEFTASAQVETRPVCPMCGENYNAGTVKHACGMILDKKRYEELVKEGLVKP